MLPPATQAWFDATHGTPTAVQARGWAAIDRGEHALLVAPTGSGKTLAAFLACLGRLIETPGARPPGTRILYVSPIKALAHDIERNLAAPLAGIVAAAATMGVPAYAPRVDVRTGDTDPRTRRQQLRDPAELAQWPLLDLDDGVPGALRLNWATWFDFAGAGAVKPTAGRLVFSFVDQAVQAAVRGQGVALVRSPFLQDVLASGDLVMPFPQRLMPAGYRHVLILGREVARRPHVAEFVAWLNEQIAQAPRL